MFNMINEGLSPEGFRVLTQLVEKKLAERGCANVSLPVRVTFCALMQDDEYRVAAEKDNVSVTTGGISGAFAALGDYLRRCYFDARGAFAPFTGEFSLKPVNPIHGMYFASHFHNFYEEAPIDEVYAIIDDLALRGCNGLMAWYDMHQFDDVDTPESRLLLDRVRSVFSHASLVGMKTVFTMIANESFRTSDPAIRAEWTVQNGYFALPCGHYHVEICPNKKGGLEEILRQRRRVMKEFEGTTIDYISIWPYDQGGCTCSKCTPWGANGFLKTMDALRELFAEIMPKSRLLCSVWYYDHFIKDEWKAFIEKMDTGKYDYVDMLFGYFANGEPIPESIRNGKMPGNKRMISFPEISMWGALPWGGFGANPMPMRMQNNFTENGNIYSGALPYSEGIFEDINKALMLAFYSGRTVSAEAVLREYARFEFGLHGELENDFVNLTMMMEETLNREAKDTEGRHQHWNQGGYKYDEVRFEIAHPEKINEVKALAEKIDAALPQSIRSGWRWRILYIRAMVDVELAGNGMHFTEKFEEYMDELVKIYHAENAFYVVTPLTRRMVEHSLGGII